MIEKLETAREDHAMRQDEEDPKITEEDSIARKDGQPA